MLSWDESDFLQCFEVKPFFEDDDQSYEYLVKTKNFNFQVKVIPEKDVLAIRFLSKDTGDCLAQNYYAVLGQIDYEQDYQTMVLNECVPVGDDEFYSNKIEIEKIKDLLKFRIEITIKPEVCVRSFLS